MTRLTLLVGGGHVYLYPDQAADPALRDRIAVQRALPCSAARGSPSSTCARKE